MRRPPKATAVSSRYRRLIISGIGLLLLFSLCGCEAKFTDYYPLHVSNQWIYRVTTYEGRVKQMEERIIKRHGDTYHFNNKEIILLNPGQAIVNKQGITILRDPIELGAQWVDTQMQFEITALNQPVTVPAGTFDETLEITWTTKYPGNVIIHPGDEPTLKPGESPRVFVYKVTYARKVGKIKEELWITQPDGRSEREMLAELLSYRLH